MCNFRFSFIIINQICFSAAILYQAQPNLSAVTAILTISTQLKSHNKHLGGSAGINKKDTFIPIYFLCRKPSTHCCA